MQMMTKDSNEFSSVTVMSLVQRTSMGMSEMKTKDSNEITLVTVRILVWVTRPVVRGHI